MSEPVNTCQADHDWYGEQPLWNEDIRRMQWRRKCWDCGAVLWTDRLEETS